jgi:hypothetical protein
MLQPPAMYLHHCSIEALVLVRTVLLLLRLCSFVGISPPKDFGPLKPLLTQLGQSFTRQESQCCSPQPQTHIPPLC